MTAITESIIEQAALVWLESLGWKVARGTDIAPDTFDAERTDFGKLCWNGCSATSSLN